MEADIHTLFQSDSYRILDFRCRCKECSKSAPEYSEVFSISFIRTGNFLFHVFRNSYDAFNGGILVTKPGYEHQVTHLHYSVPDECTIFEFTGEFYDQLKEAYTTGYFTNNDLHSILINTNAETEFLHHSILKRIGQRSASKLEIDTMVMELIPLVIAGLAAPKLPQKLNERIKRNHLNTIERAKQYMAEHFTDDLSLFEVAKYSFVSPFHFSRLFKTFTSSSPHQYLLNMRLKKAELLLKNSSLPVSDICFSSGFNSTQYFVSAFRQKYNCPPSGLRESRVKSPASRV